MEAAREVLAARALDREISRVHAPDAWFLKRGTTPESVTHALLGNEFTAARRRGNALRRIAAARPVFNASGPFRMLESLRDAGFHREGP